MEAAGKKLALILATVGLIVAAVTVFCAMEIFDPSRRSPSFAFTVGFIVFQELACFFGKGFQGFRKHELKAANTVQSSTDLTVLFLYNLVAVGTVLLFNLFLMPDIASPKVYYAVCVSETLLAVAFYLVMLLPALFQKASHAKSESARNRVQELHARCENLYREAKQKQLPYADSILALAEFVQFAEGLRKSDAALEEFSTQLDDLEASVTRGFKTDVTEKIVQNLKTTANRRVA